MAFFNNEELSDLRKKYANDRIVIFLGGKKPEIKQYKNLIKKCLDVLSKDLNYDLYIFEPDDDRSYNKYGTVFHYDLFSVNSAVEKINDLYANGVYRIFVLNTDIMNKELLNEFFNYKFLYMTSIEDICTPVKHDGVLEVADADVFNIVRDVEGLPLEKVICCSKDGIKEFKEHRFNEQEKLFYLELNEKDRNKHLKIVDALLD